MTTDLILTLVCLFSFGLAALVLLIARRKPDVLNKKMGLYLLAGLVIASGLGAALTKTESATTAFYWLEGMVLVLGVAHLVMARSQFTWVHTAPISDELTLLLLTAALLAMAQTLVYGLILPAGTFLSAMALGWLSFFLPTLFMLAYEAFVKIPARVYRKWFYPVDREVPLIELVDTIRLHVQVSKAPDHPQLTTYTVKAPIDRSLHDLFHYMIYSNNNEEDPENPIQYHEVDTEGSLLGWVFYRPKLGGFLKQYLDPSLSLSRSKLTSDAIIVARSYVSSIQR
ncbi:TssN family type VI secretion system protein [Fibrella forsythiae]|uniref:TssN family type VI secretion system protein n=1 Tax=Fibrella forsythiae TaxID=2817061 RepID=A0ABS3JNG9_9BACT|nr:TssN family type VI secretion system protein [Fibrella forsythiae]MBO0950447.1 hypothetical protein [Fibrella forsythiae]